MKPASLLVLATSFFALAAFQAGAQAVTATDGLGRTVTLDAPPERIVALYNESFGHLATLGVRPVAVLANPEMLADEETYLAGGASIPQVGNSDGNPDPELIASHSPDLIFVWGAEEVESLGGIAPVFAMDGTAVAGDEAYSGLRAVAAILGKQAEAEAAIAEFDARVAAYAALVPDRPTVLKLSASGENAFWFGSSNDPFCALMNRIATCAWEDLAGEGWWSYEGTLEQALALDPDVIVLNNWTELSTEDFLANLVANPLWAELRAVQEERVIFQPKYANPIFSSIAAGHKAVDMIIPAIFPEVFPDGALTDEEVAAATGN